MPVYLFTFHAYRSWMPDHRRGYTRRGEGYLPPDKEMAERYRDAAVSDSTLFDRGLQRALLEEAQIACRHQRTHLHGGSTESTHIHLLVSWRNVKGWMRVRSALKMSLSIRLAREDDARNVVRENEEAKGRYVLKLSRGGSRKHVKERDHFDYLMKKYLPDHGGVKWFEDRGWMS